MSKQPQNSQELLGEEKYPRPLLERPRQVRFNIVNLGQSRSSSGEYSIEEMVNLTEAAAVKALQELRAVPTKPELDMPQASMASMVVESSANDETAARNAVGEAFKNAN